ncbi:MAG: trigger factor [Actinomycetia bacterium]|nr:trigger factor [Actinomycetes bacterium]
MKSTVEPVEGNKVRLVVDVEEAELEPALDAAWKEISKEVRLPGFRPGKAPRKLLEKQIEPGYARSEALRNALPEHYTKAVIEHDVDVVAPPELDITEGEEDGDITFEAIVEIRPVINVAGYGGLRVEVPSPEVGDDEIEEQVDRLRSQYGELADVERAAGESDYVTIDISGTRDGEPVEGLETEGYSYLVGSGAITAEFDENLTGASAGDELSFDADHPDPDEDPVHFEIKVSAVQERELPELTDEWVGDATEFDTVDDFRADVRERLESGREEATRSSVRSRIGAELAKLVEDEVPESMVGADLQARIQSMTGQLAQSGIGMEDYLRIMGKDPESFTAELREAAEEGVRVDLALRAVVAAEGLDASDEEIEEEVASMIGGAGISIEDGMTQLRDAGQLSAVRSEIANRKAMEWLVERSEVVDPDGNAIPEELLAAPEPHDHSHDDHADHDHD